jgi:hypothetical protein
VFEDDAVFRGVVELVLDDVAPDIELPVDVLPDIELPDAGLVDEGCPAVPLCPLDIVPDGGVPLAPEVPGVTAV